MNSQSTSNHTDLIRLTNSHETQHLEVIWMHRTPTPFEIVKFSHEIYPFGRHACSMLEVLI